MNLALQTTCEEFLIYEEMVNKALHTDDVPNLSALCAYILLSGSKDTDVKGLQACRKALRKHTGFFSPFRGVPEPLYTSMLAAEEDPALTAGLADEAYGILKNHIGSGPYTAFVSILMALYVPPGHFERRAESIGNLFRKIKADYPSLTGKEDVVFTAVIDLQSRVRVEKARKEMRELYKRLSSVMSSNAAQSLSHALTMCPGNVNTKIRNYQAAERILKKNDIQANSFDAVPLGILCNMAIDAGQLKRDMLSVFNHLRELEMFGIYVPEGDLLLQTFMILCVHYMCSSLEMTTALLISAASKMELE